jgi:hypothetical protein
MREKVENERKRERESEREHKRERKERGGDIKREGESVA